MPENDFSFSEPAPKEERLLRCEWLSLLAIFLCGLWRFLSYSFFDGEARYLPGFGLTVTAWVMLAGAVACAVRRGKIRASALTVVVPACAAVLAGTYSLYINSVFRLLNLPVIALAGVWGMMLLTGEAPMNFRSWLKSFERFLVNCFSCVLLPFRALGTLLRGRRKGQVSAEFVIGILLFIVVIPIVIVLLSGADAVFENLFTRLGKVFENFDGSGIVRFLFWTVPVTFVLFSQTVAPARRERTEGEERKTVIAPSLFILTLIGLAVSFAVFGYIQVRYLFLGEEAAVMAGGYAEYARGGFFQLLGVAVISLLVVQPSLACCGENRLVRALCCAVALLTEIIVVSAYLRMKLYVDEYGLTILRVLVQWANVMLFVCFAASAVKSVRPQLRIFRLLVLTVLISWTLLCLVNPPARIAAYNVRMAENGSVALDREYLRELGPAGLKYLRKDEGPEAAMEEYQQENEQPTLYESSLEWILYSRK